MLLLGCGGCALKPVTYHSLPDQTPAADNAAALQRERDLEAAQAAAAARARSEGAEARRPITPAEAPSLRTYDPLSRLNRFSYRFNTRFDRLVFLPAANAYRRIPHPLQAGVHHFFGNLSEIDSVINYTLQGRLGRGVRSLGRFVINSTVGIGGLFEVAERLRLPNRPTGFATTLAKWGMHPGAYVVIPFYGPSSTREAIGLVADYGTLYAINPIDLYRGTQSWGLGVVNAVDQRAHVDFEYYATGSPFEYEMIRFLYVRKLLIEDSALHPTPKTNSELPAGE
ncbi:MAG TPA: VacJ family lipoprotein [Steroidobacteraceae bacterium]|nr:VacJ family lipoprotein [Steroidobacteraceae bacterium]